MCVLPGTHTYHTPTLIIIRLYGDNIMVEVIVSRQMMLMRISTCYMYILRVLYTYTHTQDCRPRMHDQDIRIITTGGEIYVRYF